MLSNLSKKKLNLSADYLVFFAIIILCVTAISLISASFAYKSTNSLKKQEIQKKAKIVEQITQESIAEYGWKMRFLAEQIAKSNNDLRQIEKIIKNNKLNLLDSGNNLGHQNIYWVDKNDTVLINNKLGILQYQQQSDYKDQIFLAKKQQNNVIISGKNDKNQKYNSILARKI